MKDWSDFGIDLPAGASGEIDLQCPECSSSRKKRAARCLSVNAEKQTWICFHCGWTGSLKEGARKTDPGWAKPRFSKPSDRPILDLPEKLVEWFGKRGVTPVVLHRNKIGFADVYVPQIEEHAGCAVFPYVRAGELINRKFRDAHKNFRMEPGAERVLYGLDDIQDDQLVFVEGEIDKLSIEVAGFTSCVSVPDGAPSVASKDYASKFTYLDSAADRLAKVKRFVLAVDADAPGQALEAELARRLGPEKCRRVEWPDGIKDANEMLQRHGVEALKAVIDGAKDLPLRGVIELGSLTERIAALYENGYERGVSTGWFGLDRHFTVRAGEFTVVTGIPGSGKSNFIDNLVVNLSKRHRWRFAMFSPENQPVEEHAISLAEKYLGLPFSEGKHRRMAPAELARGLDFIGDHFSWILPSDEEDWELDNILRQAASLCHRQGINGLVVDPWNELEALRPPQMTETEYISKSLRKLRQFGRQRKIHVFVVVHPMKLVRDKEGNYPVPTLYDCAGSAHWRNKADNGICVWRDLTGEDTERVDIHIQKIRFRHVGRRGLVPLFYDKVCATYSEDPASYGRDVAGAA